MNLKGVFSPVVTIQKEDGSIDYASMEKHIDHLAAAGLNGLLFFGSLGEFYAFSAAEKKDFLSFAVKVASGRTKVISGIGGTSRREVLELAEASEKAGVDAVNILSPYYFPPTEQAAFSYFSTLASRISLPIQLYNFPARVGADLTPALVARLAAEHSNIIGVKDTVDNISHTRKMIRAVKAARPDFSVLSGFDEYYLVNRASGGDGVLSGLTNVVPELFVKLHRSYESKDFDQTEACAKTISRLMAIYDEADLFVVAIKAAVKRVSLPDISTFTQAPAIPLTKEEARAIEAILQDASVLS